VPCLALGTAREKIENQIVKTNEEPKKQASDEALGWFGLAVFVGCYIIHCLVR
jgi:hypothetical protein